MKVINDSPGLYYVVSQAERVTHMKNIISLFVVYNKVLRTVGTFNVQFKPWCWVKCNTSAIPVLPPCAKKSHPPLRPFDHQYLLKYFDKLCWRVILAHKKFLVCIAHTWSLRKNWTPWQPSIPKHWLRYIIHVTCLQMDGMPSMAWSLVGKKAFSVMLAQPFTSSQF